MWKDGQVNTYTKVKGLLNENVEKKCNDSY